MRQNHDVAMQIQLFELLCLLTEDIIGKSGGRWLHIYNLWFNWSSARCWCVLMDSRALPIRNNLPDWKLQVLMGRVQARHSVLLLSYWHFYVPVFIYFTELEQGRLYFKNLYFTALLWNSEIWWSYLWLFILVSQVSEALLFSWEQEGLYLKESIYLV